MARRLFDVTLATAGLLVTAPLWLLAAAGIWWSSPGPVFYRAPRVGKDGREFTLLKFRSMHQAAAGSPITAAHDQRVFPFGAWLRASKCDELPQLLNVLRGDMSIIGPRPEDPRLVRDYYGEAEWVTLRVRPGLASPGSIYNYTHGEATLSDEHPALDYGTRLLPLKLSLDRVYVQQASLFYDLRLIARTLGVLTARALGRRHFKDPPELSMCSPHK